MNSDIKTVRLNWDSIKELKEVMLIALEESPYAFSVDLIEYKQKENFWWDNYLAPFFDQYSGAMFAAIDKDNNIVGIGGILFNNSIRKKHIATIVWLYVLKNFRKQKVASKLVEECIKEAKQRNIKKLTLTVNSTQIEAQNLYSKYKFEKSGELKNELLINGEYYSVFIMESEVIYP